MKRDTRTTEQPDAGVLARTAGRLRRHPLALLSSLLPILLAGVALAAKPPESSKQPAPAKPATPTINTHPAGLTNQTSAQFTYAESTSGAAFECRLDSGSFAACAGSGKSYAGPLDQGNHTFKVRAFAAGKTSDEAAYTWTVDTAAPSGAVSFPVDGSALSSAAWGHGCPGRAGICGTAKDANGVTAVYVSIRQGAGKWWGGGAFDQTTEVFRATTLSSGRGGTAWSYNLQLPADGGYTVHVRAQDAAGNTTSPAAQASATFTVDTLAPPAPSIVSGPEPQTVQKSATFSFRDSQAGVGFLCSRDHGRMIGCSSPITYPSNARGAHTFTVQARDGAGNLSPAATYTWSVVAKLEESGKPFAVTGAATAPLAPGFSSPLALTVTNPNSVAITVTELQVAVATLSSKAGCEGPANLALTQSNVSAANPLVVAANGHVTLPSGAVSAPQVQMKDLPTNQDACKNAAFTFNYSGSAHS